MDDILALHGAEHTQARTRLLWRMGEALALWGRRMRERDELAHFTYRELRDAGFSDSDVWLEINKPFWRE